VTGRHAYDTPAGAVMPVDAATAVGELARYGRPVAWNAVRRIVLGGSDAVWLVVAGAVELYAEEAAGRATPHYLGTATAGALLPGSPARPGRVVVARPSDDAQLRLLAIADLTGLWSVRIAAALAHGVDAGLRVLHSTLPPPPPETALVEAGRTVRVPAGQTVYAADRVRWVHVQVGALLTADGLIGLPAGSVTALAGTAVVATTETFLDVRGTYDLLAMGVLWQCLADQHEQYLAAIDIALADRDRGSAERLKLARQASERAFARAGQVLDAVATRSAAAPRRHRARRPTGWSPTPPASPCPPMWTRLPWTASRRRQPAAAGRSPCPTDGGSRISGR
jgi:hypothetical protein